MFKKLLVVAITSAALMSGSLLAGAPAQAHPGKPKPPKPYPASVVTHCHAKMKYYKVHRGQFPKVDVWVTSGVSKRIKGTVKVSVGHKVTYKNYNGHAKRIWLTKRLGLGKYLVYVQFLPKTHSIFKRCSTTTAFKVFQPQLGVAPTSTQAGQVVPVSEWREGVDEGAARPRPGRPAAAPPAARPR